MRLLLCWLVNALSLVIIAYLFPGIEISNFGVALIVAVILALINVFIRPIIILITLPINILTLGLFTLVINGLLFWFAASFIEGFFIAGFWSALFGALVFSIISSLMSYLVLKNKITVA